MDSEFSDSEFCETNFVQPSPLKRRNSLITDPKKRKEFLEKTKLVKMKLEKSEAEFFSCIGHRLEGVSSISENGLKILKEDEIIFLPRGRDFFIDFEDDLSPSSWFPEGSIFHNKTKEEFISCWKQGLIPKCKSDDEVTRALQSYCFSLLSVEEDELTANLLLQSPSIRSSIPYKAVCLRKRGSSHLGRFLQLLQNSVLGYTPDEAHALLREAISASLDSKSLNAQGFSTLLSSCLRVSSKKYQIEDDLNWIIERNLEPEEMSYLLGLLPQSGPFKDFGLVFAAKALSYIVRTSDNPSEELGLTLTARNWGGYNSQSLWIQMPRHCFKLASLASFLKVHEREISSLSLNTIFHFLHILNYIFSRLPSYDHEPLKEIIEVIDGLKRNYQHWQCVSVFIIYESINRICTFLRQRIPVHLRQPLLAC